jgi:DUF4097 and DUF4098 domain-containing protein YvlB
MRTRQLSLTVILIAAALTITGCCICCNWHSQEHYEKAESLSAPMTGIEQLQVDTSFGEVVITGADTAECNVSAKIRGGSPTTDEAKQLVEQTKITLQPQGKILIIKIDKPFLKNNRSIGVDFNITVPVKTGINCKTSYGRIDLKNIQGDIVAHTSFGEIKANNITGKIRLDTSYGAVDCAAITTGDFFAGTSFGEVKVAFSNSCPPDVKAKIETSYGEIDVGIPSGFSGQVAAETSFGSIRSDLPITVKGEIGNNHLKGTIGQPALSGVEGGNGMLTLKTSFGSVKIR